MDLLVGPGEDGFPEFADGGEMQNPLEGALMNIADELQLEQHMGLEEIYLQAEMEVNQVNLDNQQGQKDPDNNQLDND